MVPHNEEGIEHQGKIVAQYRKINKWSRSKLAEALRVDVSTIYRMEQSSVIKDIQRRQFLVGLLGIPSVLMGLEDGAVIPTNIKMNNDQIGFFEQEMAIRWDVYHTGGTTRAYRGLDAWLKEVERFAQDVAPSVWKSRAYSLLSMSYQLRGSTLRDMIMYEQAHMSYEKAFSIAQELNDIELMASSLARRGVTYIQQQMPMDAIEYIHAALQLINGLGYPSLRGYILQALSEAYAMAQQPKASWRHIELAERTLERKGSTFERSNCQLNTTSIVAQKGINAVLLHDNERAITLIDKGLIQYDPTLIRGRARLQAQKAEAYYGLGLVDISVATAEDALTLANSVGSNKTVRRIRDLHNQLVDSSFRKESSVHRLGALLSI